MSQGQTDQCFLSLSKQQTHTGICATASLIDNVVGKRRHVDSHIPHCTEACLCDDCVVAIMVCTFENTASTHTHIDSSRQTNKHTERSDFLVRKSLWLWLWLGKDNNFPYLVCDKIRKITERHIWLIVIVP